jgi:hypothetical protein
MIFGIAGIALAVAAALLYGVTRGAWLDAVLFGIALGMSMLPEEQSLKRHWGRESGNMSGYRQRPSLGVLR